VTIILPNATGGAQRSFFNGGNTQLAPTQAWNFDATAEYYTPTGGALIASIFYKDVKDLVQTTTRVGTLPGQGTRQFDITSASNAQSGRVYGFEVGANQPLTFLPGALSGLGVQANYTFVDSQTQLPGIGRVPFGGSSKHNANAAVYYERGGWNARLAFFYRSRQFAEAYSPGNNRELLPQYSLDLSASKKIIDNLEVRVNFVNLTKRDVYEVTSSSDRIQNYYERPRTFLAGLRLSM
jgi:iron complex outermembrane recepter protein